ncbi:efflux RND transporter permease subunit [Arcicella aquatica]|uniref:Efflux RND transporter permease subunit n=1 Tax=Arcicella aquatica TaxID=217141 RepID=A0ABU5QQT9_9BACT|nr:efflux RND transporter permease subunit [Arcicella aquatica]MEA5259383.1 efflux RND transporter permease subunit [Arcicella aquatica]
MVRFLLHRPIAVLITTLALMALGLVTFNQIPVSLLPEIAIPEITVQVSYPNASARELQKTIVKPLRNQLQQVNHLSDLEAETQDGLAIIKLRFDFGTNINLAYIETHEKIDGIMGQFPREIERPKVIKAGAADIPVFNLNISAKGQNDEFGLQLSEFCENAIRRRIEQMKEVALVDMTGLSKPEVIIIPDRSKLQSLGITEQFLSQILQKNNIDLGNLLVKDGQYQYSIRFASTLKTQSDIENIYFKIGDIQKGGERVVQLKELAKVKIQEQKLRGLYTFNGKRAVCFSIIKQSDTQLLKLKKELNAQIEYFKKDYPQLDFAISQDQTELLDLSINNLIGNILFGGLCTFMMIFFFMNDLKTPILIGIVIPVSLVVTFLCFYLFNISINIVSLAGLVLGIGEIIDSAIIVIENIEQYREEGHPLDEACIEGTQEVIMPLFTSILTNSAVFLPLIFISGIAGALFFDQAIAVSLSLGISLLCSYTLIPVLYRLFYLKEERLKGFVPKKVTLLMRFSERAYDSLLNLVFRQKALMLIFFILLIVITFPIFKRLDKRGMPIISRTELETKIDWNEPITIEENNNRINDIINQIKSESSNSLLISAFVGQQQFLLNRELQQNFNESLLSIKLKSQKDYEQIKNRIADITKNKYPNAITSFSAAKNVFEALFNTSEAPLQARVTSNNKAEVPDIQTIKQVYFQLSQHGFSSSLPAQQSRVYIQILTEKILYYDVDYERIVEVLKTIFNENNVGSLKAEQKYIPILLGGNSQEIDALIQSATVLSNKGQVLPIKALISVSNQKDYKSFFSGKNGDYIPFNFDLSSENVPNAQREIQSLIMRNPDLNVNFTGEYFRNLDFIKELGVIILVAIALLYFILTAQFESLAQPLIVMLTIAFGLTGAMLFLFLFSNSINIMSAIGMIVLIGILDNDSILKIDTMNRTKDSMSLIESIKLSGKRRLKSQLMTFLTTILGLLPVLFSSGLGAELQKPLAISVIGGMCLGLFISMSFIPLIYWFMYHKNYK